LGQADGVSSTTTAVSSSVSTEITEPPAPSVVRSPSDVLRLVVSGCLLILLLVVQWLFGETLTTFMSELLSGLHAIPGWMVNLVVVVVRVGTGVVLVTGLLLSLRHGRWRQLATVLVAGAGAAGLVLALDAFSPDDGDTVTELDSELGFLTSGGFPTAVGIGVASAMLTAAAPWLSRRWRRVGWLLVIGMTAVRFLVAPVSFDSVRAIMAGWVVGAAVLVIMGGPLRRPNGQSIAVGMATAGVPLARIEQASVDARGSSPYFGVAADGRKLFIKALGQDQRSADLLFRVYRWLKGHDLGDERPFNSLRRAVEHEAFVALAARDAGIRTPRLAAFAMAAPNGFVLAYEAIEGRSLDRVDPDDVTDAVLVGVWEQVVVQRHHRIAHRDLRLANIFLAADGDVWMIDYGFSELAASDLLLSTDIAELLASSTLQVGTERAVAQALAAVGPAALHEALDRLHPWALGGATRTSLAERHGLLEELRDRVGAVAASTPDRASAAPVSPR
jgi:undecaprenyl-diphosphatase